MGREFELIKLVKIYPEAQAFVRGIYIGGIVACVYGFERQVLQIVPDSSILIRFPPFFQDFRFFLLEN